MCVAMVTNGFIGISPFEAGQNFPVSVPLVMFRAPRADQVPPHVWTPLRAAESQACSAPVWLIVSQGSSGLVLLMNPRPMHPTHAAL